MKKISANFSLFFKYTTLCDNCKMVSKNGMSLHSFDTMGTININFCKSCYDILEAEYYYDYSISILPDDVPLSFCNWFLSYKKK